MIGKYNDMLFNAFRKGDKIKLSTRKNLENGFERLTITKTDIFSIKYVPENQLQELYDIDFFAVWKDKSFNCGSHVEKGTVILRTRTHLQFAREHGFEELDRDYYVKEVPIEECTVLGVTKTDFLNGKARDRRIIEAPEFLKLYKENVVDLR